MNNRTVNIINLESLDENIDPRLLGEEVNMTKAVKDMMQETMNNYKATKDEYIN